MRKTANAIAILGGTTNRGYIPFMQTWNSLLFVTAGLLVLCIFTGCRSVSPAGDSVVSTPVSPVWDKMELRRSIRYLNHLVARKTSPNGAVEYVAARMAGFELQPGYGGQFEAAYQTAKLVAGPLRMFAVDSDTLTFEPGRDVRLLSESGEGLEWSDALAINPKQVVGLNGKMVLISQEHFLSSKVQDAKKAEVAVILVVGKLSKMPPFSTGAAQPIHAGSRPIAVQITPEAVARLLSIRDSELPGWMDVNTGKSIIIKRHLHVEVERRVMQTVEHHNAMGYVAGKDPKLRQELVIVSTDIDVPVPEDPQNHASVDAISAFLEMARSYNIFSDKWSLPDRTLLFAGWTGNKTGHAGLRDFFQNPSWPVEMIRSVIYVGLSKADSTSLASVLSPLDIPLYRVSIGGTTGLNTSQLATRSHAGERTPWPESPVDKSVEGAAIRKAVMLADIANKLMIREAVRPGPPVPVFNTKMQNDNNLPRQ